MAKKTTAASPSITREAWLLQAAELMRPWFADAALTPPPIITVSIGWPSTRALSSRNRALGQCFGAQCAIDKVPAIFISPLLNNDKAKDGGSARVLDVLLHEMIHAVMPEGEGHGRKFAKAAMALGLEGKPTHTTAGEALKAKLVALVKKLGPIPHAALDPKQLRKKVQTTRMHKLECGGCGYVVRAASRWIETGLPTCHCGEEFEPA